MKVGVITFFKTPNYGAFLSVFAMKKKIEELGGDCYFIDIHKNKISLKNTFLYYFTILKVAITIVFSGNFNNLIQSIKYKNIKEKSFIEFQKILETAKNNKDIFDLIIIGSDEIFNITGYINFDFTEQLCKKNRNSKKIISYAASCGTTTFEKIQKYGFEAKMRQALLNFDAISVRNQNTCELVKKLADVEPHIHIDPVFLYDFKNYLSSTFTKNNYILLYSFQYKITKNEQNEIIKFAKENNKKIISIGCYYDWCNEALLPKTPFEVLDYVKNADCIISDTFHGIVFSIKYNKRFCALTRSNNKYKINYLLKQFNLENRKATNFYDISKILKTENNYFEVNQSINKEIQKSIVYLSNFISLPCATSTFNIQ